MPPNKFHPFDARLEHRAVASAAQTSTAVVDTITERAAQRTQYRTMISLEAIAIDGNDELYTFVVELSNDGFSTIEVAAITEFGATEVRQSGAPDSVAGDVKEILWSTELGDTKYAASRLKCFHAGSSTSITYHAFSTVIA